MFFVKGKINICSQKRKNLREPENNARSKKKKRSAPLWGCAASYCFSHFFRFSFFPVFYISLIISRFCRRIDPDIC